MSFWESLQEWSENFAKFMGPHWEVSEDADGQLVIHTGLRISADDEIEEFPKEDSCQSKSETSG